MLKNKHFKTNTMGAFNKFFTAIIILIPFFVLSQKEYFPTNSGVKVVNEPYKAFVNATIVINSEKTIKNGTLIFRDGKIIDVGSGIKIPKNSIVIDKKGKFIYPSFIETTSSMSVKEAKRLTYSTRSALYGPSREGFYWNDHILSDYRAYLDYKYDTNKAKELRASGFGVGKHTAPMEFIVEQESSWR